MVTPLPPRDCPCCAFVPRGSEELVDHLATHAGFELAPRLIQAIDEQARLKHAICRANWISRAEVSRRTSWLSRAVLDWWPEGEEVSLLSVADAVGERPACVTRCLARLATEGVLEKTRRGNWRLLNELDTEAPRRAVGSG